ncbi:MAG: hypothetical protein AB7C89_08110 [Intestinibacillus sp.]
MQNDMSNPQNRWPHLKDSNVQNNNSQDVQDQTIPQDSGDTEISEQELEEMFPDLYPQLKPYIDKIAELLRNQQLTASMINSFVDDILYRASAGNFQGETAYAIPAQTNPRRRNRPYPRPYPLPYPYYPPFGYPIYGYDFSPEDLVRIMLLQRLGIYPYY